MKILKSIRDTAVRADDAFIELGRMPVREECWDDPNQEVTVLKDPWLSIAYWTIGWWIPIIAALIIALALIQGASPLDALWYGTGKFVGPA